MAIWIDPDQHSKVSQGRDHYHYRFPESAVGLAAIDCVDGSDSGSGSESDFGLGSGSDSNRHHFGFAVLSDLVKVYSTRQSIQTTEAKTYNADQSHQTFRFRFTIRKHRKDDQTPIIPEIDQCHLHHISILFFPPHALQTLT